MPIPSDNSERATRRDVLRTATSAVALSALASAHTFADEVKPVVKNGRIKQSIVPWCFEPYWDIPKQIQIARQLGLTSIELLDAKYYPLLKEAGLTNALCQLDLSPLPPFERGFNNPAYHEQVSKAVREAIDAAAAFGYRKVICFTGYRENIPDDVGAANCVAGLKQVIGYAEKHKITLCMEMLNSRVSSHPMKGHPKYQGDHTDYCIDICRRVGSPNMKLLFDVYHVQIMDGDVITRIHQHKDYIGHVHVAGNPGRGELDNNQEINFPPIMRALLDIGYEGFVGLEFIPTRDPLTGLREAIALCDV